MDKEIIYIADPMCSWCWGFSPVIEALRRIAEDRADVSLVMGGLRPGTRETMSPDFKASIRHHWEDVGRASGQPFGFDFFARDGFVYDTEPPCRAAVTVRTLDADAAFPYLEALHRAFYVDNADVTDGGVLAGLALPLGIEGGAFAETFAAAETRHLTERDFHRARALGINGFPAVLVREGQEHAVLTRGYRPLEALAPALGSWLDGEIRPVAEG